jgi:hypothetical protein
VDLELGLELTDALLRRDELGALPRSETWLETPVDAVLPAPGVDRLTADAKIARDICHLATGLDEVEHATAKLRWSPVGASRRRRRPRAPRGGFVPVSCSGPSLPASLGGPKRTIREPPSHPACASDS